MNVQGLATLGLYSQVASAGDFVVVAGQVGIDADGSLAGDGGAADQVRAAFRNLGVALSSEGLAFADVVRLQTFVVGRSVIPVFMQVRREVFADVYPKGEYPPNTLLVVAGLLQESMLCEIEAIAIRGTR